MFIKKYRGIEISLDKESGKFYAYSDKYDTVFNTSSLKSIQNKIDEYIKNNLKFTPFRVQQLYGYDGRIGLIGKDVIINGIRKDGKLTFLLDGKTLILSKYEEDKYALIIDDYSTLKKEMDDNEKWLNGKKEEYRKRRMEILSKIKTSTSLSDKLKELKEEYGIK